MSKNPNQYHSTARIATTISQSDRMRLSKEQWRVHTLDQITQNAVLEYLSQKGEQAEVSTFHYDGKPLAGIRVPFEVVEYLKKNESRVPYAFEAYHRERDTVPWKLWLKGVKSPTQILGRKFQGMHTTTSLNKAA